MLYTNVYSVVSSSQVLCLTGLQPSAVLGDSWTKTQEQGMYHQMDWLPPIHDFADWNVMGHCTALCTLDWFNRRVRLELCRNVERVWLDDKKQLRCQFLQMKKGAFQNLLSVSRFLHISVAFMIQGLTMMTRASVYRLWQIWPGSHCTSGPSVPGQVSDTNSKWST